MPIADSVTRKLTPFQPCSLPLTTLLLGMLLPSCDLPTRPVQERGFVEVLSHGSIADLSIPVVKLSLDVGGELRPGTDTHLQVTARPEQPDVVVRIELLTPEIEAAKASGWDDAFRISAGRTTPRLAYTAAALLGADEQLESTVSVAAPGYYRVLAVAHVLAPERHTAAHPIEDVAVAQAWLWVTETGGKVTPTFDPALFPDSAIRQPGPLRYRSDVRTSRNGDPSASSAHLFAPGTRTWEVLYYRIEGTSGSYVPLAGARVTGQEGLAGGTMTAVFEVTDPDGLFETGCDDSNVYAYELEVTAENSSVWVGPNNTVADYLDAPFGCSDEQLIALSEESHVFTNMRMAATAALDFFNQSRTPVEVGIVSGAPNNLYFSTTDSIVIKGSSVWGDAGAEIQAHEFGHALHHERLGGIPASIPNCSPHSFAWHTSLECAYVEGFAAYFAVVTRPDITDYLDFFEDGEPLAISMNPNSSDPNDPNGSVVEGAVAAFLLDLTDSDVEAHDSIAFPGSYLAMLMRTCEVTDGSGYIPPTGIDHLIRCMERQVDSAINSYFYNRSPASTAYTESATEPGSWNLARIRANWLRNLYDQ